MADTTKHPRPSERFRGKDVGDEYMVYDRDQDLVHVLNGSAREIFLLCDGKRSEDQIAVAFAAKYEVSEAVATKDARATLARLLEMGLLVSDD